MWSDVFGAHGRLAAGVPGYAPRAAQQQMAQRVARALERGENLAVEAGTGIGKTFAYLIPALLSGRRVIVSTGTRNLQDQLYDRDLPAVSAALGRPVTVARLKGRSNYLCLHRLALAQEEHAGSRAHGMELARIASWAQATDSGDVAQILDVEERSSVWPLVTSTVENCLGQPCPDYHRCYVLKARRRAQDAQIVIVNHHLLLADMALKEEGFGELLPGADAVIVDEAHQLPDTAVRFFGFGISSRALGNLVRDLRLEARREQGDARLEACADALLLASRELQLRLRPQDGRCEWPQLSPDVHAALDRLDEGLQRIADELAPLADSTAGLNRLARRARELDANLQRLLGADDETGLRWVDVGRQGYAMHLTPYDVSDRLHDVMSEQRCAWIFTSATLAVGEQFDHFAQRLGLSGIDGCVLASPFDYPAQGLLYLPTGMPAPGSSGYTRAVIEAALPLLKASQGRAFLLFTSHRALEEAYALLADCDGDFTLLKQGDVPRTPLLALFRQQPRAVLLGTASFWEGVDVRGEALQLVVIDKLPFASPSDPLLQARLTAARRAGEDPFGSVQLPQAVLALKQGVGRLIRDHGDRGVVMLCDPRLTARGYGQVFLRALPPFARTRRREEALEFLGGASPSPHGRPDAEPAGAYTEGGL